MPTLHWRTRVADVPHLVNPARRHYAVHDGDGSDNHREDDEEGVGRAQFSSDVERFVEEDLDAGEYAERTASVPSRHHWGMRAVCERMLPCEAVQPKTCIRPRVRVCAGYALGDDVGDL